MVILSNHLFSKKTFLFIVMGALLPSFSFAEALNVIPPSGVFGKVQDFLEKDKREDAIKLLQKALKKEMIAEERKLAEFNLAFLTFQDEKYENAIVLFRDFLKSKSDLEAYADYYIGLCYVNLKKLSEAQKEFEKVLANSPNIKLRNESSNQLGQIAIQAKNFKQARQYLFRLEKSTRGSEQYPEVIYSLALVERGLNNHRTSCKWVNKLYSKHPTYSKIADWGADLATNEIDGKPSDCKAKPDEFRTRMRNLMFGGLDQKAQAEINTVKERLGKEDRFAADQIQAQFFLQEGEVVKALELLKPYYKNKKKNFSFLMLFGSASARAGEVQLAVGSYYSAYKLNPKSKLGRQALYQSAFLSYQFQDYDGAARRFQEFMKSYPSSGLNRDAKWHMAWISYLKGDYERSYRDFSKLAEQKRKSPRLWKSFPSDRVNYWMAMSRYRQGQYDAAKPLFASLSKDNLVGYYSIAAQARLKKISQILSVSNKLAQSQKAPILTPPRAASRFYSSTFLMPSTEAEVSTDINTESEETLITNLYEEPASEEAEEAMSVDSPDLKTVEVVPAPVEKESPFSNSVLTKRFEQAKDLVTLGMKDWARWDLYEIESKTNNRVYLKSLMDEYTNVGYYHRASYIAQIQFGGQRASLGMEGGRSLWEFAYPQAYNKHVSNFAKKFEVPTELVWGIMRAESQYRRDAISPVGALGLMQVMPFTGHKVASLLGERSFSPSSLLEPEIAIKMGSRYLKRMMDTFQNTIPLVAAGYNAGPHRVKTWLASFGNLETDEFIEHIPFLETRNYVKRVMSNCQVYSDLYNGKKEMFPYLAEAVPAKVNHEVVAKENWDDI